MSAGVCLLAGMLEDTVERNYRQRCPTCLTRRVLHRGAAGAAAARLLRDDVSISGVVLTCLRRVSHVCG